MLEALDFVGVLCVEFFVARDGRLLINELAPRPHNSGHLTFDACRTSQFEQQLRAICGLPLGSPELLQPAAMANLLGDLWDGGEPNWPAALAIREVKLHLYGKATPRPGRKMGHLTAWIVLHAVNGIVASPAAGADPRFPAVLQRFLSLDDPSPTGYRALRRLDARNQNLNKTAWMDVWTESDARVIQIHVVAEGGSDYIRSKVFPGQPRDGKEDV